MLFEKIRAKKKLIDYNLELRKMRIILFLLLSWYTIGNIQAQIKEPVKFKNELKMTSETEAEIVFTASIEKGWHVYSTGLGDDGPISATFNINASNHVETMGKLQPVGKEISIYDKMFEMNVRYFEDTVQFIQKVKFTGNDYFMDGFLEFGACNDERALSQITDQLWSSHTFI